MIRFLNIIAICALIGSAGYVYTVKYETLASYEYQAKLKSQIQSERESVAVLKAEWALLNRPERLQAASRKYLDLQPMNVRQLARLSDLRNQPDRGDPIGRQIELLGAAATATPTQRSASDAPESTTQTPTR